MTHATGNGVTTSDALCPFCGHEWRRHDPDGMCDAQSSERIGVCECGRDLWWMRRKIVELSRAALGAGALRPVGQEVHATFVDANGQRCPIFGKAAAHEDCDVCHGDLVNCPHYGWSVRMRP